VFQNIEWSGHFMWVFCFSKCPAICGGHILDFTMCHVEIHWKNSADDVCQEFSIFVPHLYAKFNELFWVLNVQIHHVQIKAVLDAFEFLWVLVLKLSKFIMFKLRLPETPFFEYQIVLKCKSTDYNYSQCTHRLL
jgi:hypothetical protein